mmetsp:Transcript_91246/g.263293  ORF Transcript_91246/g.263293 Transcript_91246/m.263293 type:complete len:233 (-) Transcript_91246:887-1585(-)
MGTHFRSMPFSVRKVNCVNGGEKMWMLTAEVVSLAFVTARVRAEPSRRTVDEPSGKSLSRSTSDQNKPGENSWYFKLPLTTFTHSRLSVPTWCGGMLCPGLQHETMTEKCWSQWTRFWVQWNSLKCAGPANFAHSIGDNSTDPMRSKIPKGSAGVGDGEAPTSVGGCHPSSPAILVSDVQRSLIDGGGGTPVGLAVGTSVVLRQRALMLTMGARRAAPPVGGKTRQSSKGGE